MVILDTLDDLFVVPDLRPEGWIYSQVKWLGLRRALADPTSCGTRMRARTGGRSSPNQGRTSEAAC